MLRSVSMEAVEFPSAVSSIQSLDRMNTQMVKWPLWFGVLLPASEESLPSLLVFLLIQSDLRACQSVFKVQSIPTHTSTSSYTYAPYWFYLSSET